MRLNGSVEDVVTMCLLCIKYGGACVHIPSPHPHTHTHTHTKNSGIGFFVKIHLLHPDQSKHRLHGINTG